MNSLGILVSILIVVAGGAVDVAMAYQKHKDLQNRIDAGVLSAAKQDIQAKRNAELAKFFSDIPALEGDDAYALKLTAILNPDGSVTGNYASDRSQTQGKQCMYSCNPTI